MSGFQIPLQPHPWVSYYRVGRLLHWALLLFFLESYVYWIMLKAAYVEGTLFWIGFWSWSFMFSFVHIFQRIRSTTQRDDQGFNRNLHLCSLMRLTGAYSMV